MSIGFQSFFELILLQRKEEERERRGGEGGREGEKRGEERRGRQERESERSACLRSRTERKQGTLEELQGVWHDCGVWWFKEGINLERKGGVTT